MKGSDKYIVDPKSRQKKKEKEKEKKKEKQKEKQKDKKTLFLLLFLFLKRGLRGKTESNNSECFSILIR
jgi:hypothetical protein